MARPLNADGRQAWEEGRSSVEQATQCQAEMLPAAARDRTGGPTNVDVSHAKIRRESGWPQRGF